MRLRKVFILTISSFFYIGYLPLIPGTFGSLAGILLFYLIKNSVFIYMFSTLFVITSGFLLAGEAEKILGKKDHRYIVIDEVSGVLLSLMFIPYNVFLVILAFILFRILDALKPYPAGPLQRLKGSAGVMSDDLIAGLYTNIILQVVLRLASFITS